MDGACSVGTEPEQRNLSRAGIRPQGLEAHLGWRGRLGPT